MGILSWKCVHQAPRMSRHPRHVLKSATRADLGLTDGGEFIKQGTCEMMNVPAADTIIISGREVRTTSLLDVPAQEPHWSFHPSTIPGDLITHQLLA